VPHNITVEVGVYCRLMIITAILLIIEIHFEAIFINLGYARCAAFNSLLTGIGVDVICTYFLIYKLNLGMQGAGFAQIIVKASRITVWLVLMFHYGLFTTIFIAAKNEALFTSKEMMIFLKLAVPAVLSNISGWLIFELQIMAIANIHDISTPALAAGAIWMQSSTVLAAVQEGWLKITLMRTLNLLGMKDPGAYKSFATICFLSALVVAMLNIPLLLFGDRICSIVSNDSDVQWYFRKLIWVLVLHSQLKIACANAAVLFVPMGKGLLRVVVNIICFYFIATPISAVGALTNIWTTSVLIKLTFCLATTPMAMALIAVFLFGYLCIMDWKKVAELINARANSDKKQMQPEQEN